MSCFGFFVYPADVQLKTLKRAPLFIAVGVIGVVCLLQGLRTDFFERLENMTYDWRVRQGTRFSPPVSPDLGFVSISDKSLELVNKGMLERSYGLYWPRHVYGRVVNELAAEGARAVAFDVLFPDLRRDQSHLGIESPGGVLEPDEYFATELKRAGNVILAAEKTTLPNKLFRNSAREVGDITTTLDSDGVLRRTAAFRVYRKWHTAFETVENDPDYGVDLSNVRVESNRIVLLRTAEYPSIVIPLTNGLFDMKDFVGDKIPAGMARFAKPFTEERVWSMGIVLAAQELKLDLDRAEVDLNAGRITLRGTNGVSRVIPVDKEGYFYINWSLTADDRNLKDEPFEGLLAQYQTRVARSTNAMAAVVAERWTNKVDWRDKLVVVGSTAVGNDLTDRGATPLSENSILVSMYWNEANSLLTGQFVRLSSEPVKFLLIILMGAISAGLTLTYRSYAASLWLVAVVVLYTIVASYAYVRFRYWLPVVLPALGGGLVMHAVLLCHLVIFEQADKRRVKSVFTKMVSADVVNEVLKSEKLSLDGARRNVTVFFADIRGFTEMTDINMEKAASYVKENNLTGEAAEVVFDTQSRETLDTVNKYLKVIAQTVLKHNGTVDKFIGDCVMAFWGAPMPNPRHALSCVRAAIDAQRAVHRLNEEREAENRKLEEENAQLAVAGRPLKHLLPILSVGSGVNTGLVTVGLMGSDERLNYTVFGRDVNLASRLESFSGRGRIIISEATLAEIIQDDPTLALSCVELPPVNLKGFRTAIPVYEVPWREAGQLAPADGTVVMTRASDPTHSGGDEKTV